MATTTKTRKPITPAQTDKVLKAVDLRYAVAKMADRYADAERDYKAESLAVVFDESRHERAYRRMRRTRLALHRLLDAGMSAYKAEVYR